MVQRPAHVQMDNPSSKQLFPRRGRKPAEHELSIQSTDKTLEWGLIEAVHSLSTSRIIIECDLLESKLPI
jgi:hypothetical protein